MNKPHGVVPLPKKIVKTPGGTAPAPGGAPAAGAPVLTDHGGAVLSAVEVVPIYWGAFWTNAQGAGPNLADGLDAFFDRMLTSPFMDMLKEYNTSTTKIGYGSRLPSVKISTSEPGTATMGGGREVTDAEIQTALTGWIAANTVPATTANTLYFIYLPPKVVSDLNSTKSCTDFCGYHNHISKKTFYAVEPFATCKGCDADSSSDLDTLTKVSSHELAEAITDPALETWFDSSGNEIGDICTSGATGSDTSAFNTRRGGFLVQSEWSNAQSSCVMPVFTIGPTPRVACACDQNGNLHVCAIDLNNGLWHTIRQANGSWPFPFGDVQAMTRQVGPNAGIGPTPWVACAAAPNGDLHVCALDRNNGLWHTIRREDGRWPYAFGDVQGMTRQVGPNPGIGPIRRVACACDQNGNLHVCAIDTSDGLWHTIRQSDGRWPYAFGDVQAQTRQVGPNPGIGQIRRIACTCDQNGNLHLCAVDLNYALWHTIRRADGRWPYAFGDVQGMTRQVGPNPGIGQIPWVACSATANGDLHIFAIDTSNVLWHTIRRADGTWPFPFGDVQGMTRQVGPNPGIGTVPWVACSAAPNRDMHVCAIDKNSGLWHTIRRADGTWPFPFGDVQAQTGAH